MFNMSPWDLLQRCVPGPGLEPRYVVPFSKVSLSLDERGHGQAEQAQQQPQEHVDGSGEEWPNFFLGASVVN
jgi:hypothetical protein